MANQTIDQIHGRINDAQNRPLARLVVQAFDRGIRAEEPLGEVTTDCDSKCQIVYAVN